MLDRHPRHVDESDDVAGFHSLMLARAELSAALLQCVSELIAAGHDLRLLTVVPIAAPTDIANSGLRVWGYMGTLNTRTAETVLDAATRSLSGTYHLDLRGLRTFSLLAWPAIQRATHGFRGNGGHLQVSVPDSTARLSRPFLDSMGFADVELANR
jgi:hypothetical protein